MYVLCVRIYIRGEISVKYVITNMNDDIVKQIISWRYEGIYSEYNMDSYEELKARGSSILKPEKSKNYLCYFKEDELVGYTNITKKTNGDLFLGIGLAPKYCGKGLGNSILENSIKDAKERYPGSKIKLQVRSWNERARKCYEKAGFKFIKKDVEQDHNGVLTEFAYMEYML